MRPRKKPKDDDQPMRMSVQADIPNGLVKLEFEKSVGQIALAPNSARQLASLLIRKANEVLRPS